MGRIRLTCLSAMGFLTPQVAPAIRTGSEGLNAGRMVRWEAAERRVAPTASATHQKTGPLEATAARDGAVRAMVLPTGPPHQRGNAWAGAHARGAGVPAGAAVQVRQTPHKRSPPREYIKESPQG